MYGGQQDDGWWVHDTPKASPRRGGGGQGGKGGRPGEGRRLGSATGWVVNVWCVRWPGYHSSQLRRPPLSGASIQATIRQLRAQSHGVPYLLAPPRASQ